MTASERPTQRPGDAKLLVVDPTGAFTHASRSRLLDFLRRGDLIVANDAAVLPASLHGTHQSSGEDIEVRLAGRSSLLADDVHEFRAIVFGAGDYRTRTENRRPPPILAPGDRLALGPLRATVRSSLGHPRLVLLRFDGAPETIWAGLARHGRPIQYAHISEPLRLWDVWSPIAALAVAFEPPSASFALDWRTIDDMRRREIVFATITHAAGISSTGDPELDRRLPFDEPYRLSEAAAAAIRRAKARHGRIVAVGTTVVRALEDAADGHGSVRAGVGLATGRIGPGTRLRIVDAILTGTHEPDTSHYQLLRAFVGDRTLDGATRELEARRYRTHEFGDSMLIHAQPRRRADAPVLRAREEDPPMPAAAWSTGVSSDLCSHDRRAGA